MKGWVGWAFSTALALVTLQALASREAPGRIGDLLKDANVIVARVLDPDVPAIPDVAHRTTAAAPAGPGKALGTLDPTTTTIPRLPVPGQTRAV